MKRNILALIMLSALAISLTFGFVSCKKEAATDAPAATEEPATDAATEPATEEAK